MGVMQPTFLVSLYVLNAPHIESHPPRFHYTNETIHRNTILHALIRGHYLVRRREETGF